VEYGEFHGIGGFRVRLFAQVEADGPTHFTENTSRPLGRTLLRNALLQAGGWVPGQSGRLVLSRGSERVKSIHTNRSIGN
jgi:hypothetical protein